MDFNTNTDNKDEWLTPLSLIQSLGGFDLDPCAPHPDRRPWDTAITHFHKEMNGLVQPWYGRVWCNPPYGRDTFLWMRRMAEHGNGVALIFARTETKGFQQYIWGTASGLLFLAGRVAFYDISGKRGDRPNAPSCLVAWGESNVKALAASDLEGALVKTVNRRAY